MADVITVTEVKGKSRAGMSIQGRTYSIQARVETNNPRLGPRTALMNVGVYAGATYRFPLGGDATEWDYGSYLQTIESEAESEDGLQWLCTLTYGPYSLTDQGGAGAENNTWVMNPLSAPPTVKWSSDTEEIACMYDRAGNPILNKAGDPFDPPLTRPSSTPIATVTRMLASFDPAWIVTYKDKVNNATWMGFPAGTVLCKDVSADRVFDNDWGWLWQQTLQFAFRPIVLGSDDTTVIQPGWAALVLNAGLRKLKSGVVEQVLIDGAPVSSPVPLTSGGDYDPDDSSVPNYLTFDIYPEVDFSGFDLPSDLFSVEGGDDPFGGS